MILVALEPYQRSSKILMISKGSIVNEEMKKSLNQQCLNEQEFKLKYPEYIKFLHPVCRNSNGYAWVEEIKTRCKELDEFYQDEHRTMERFNLVAFTVRLISYSRLYIEKA